MRLLLIRHAQSVNNALPEHERVEDPPLTELGQRQAAALAEWLRPQRLAKVVASPFRRSLETAEHIRRQLELPAEVWVDLHEQGGCYRGHEPSCYEGRPGMNQAEILAHFPHYELETAIDEQGWWKCRPYESIDDAVLRARRLVKRTIKSFGHCEHSIAYIIHADFKRLLLGEMFAHSSALLNGQASSLYNTGVTEVAYNGDGFVLEQINSVAHLPDEMWSA